MFDRLKKKPWWNIIENTSWMIFDKVFMLLVSLVVTVKVANYYGATDYGIYQYAASIVALFEILVTFVDGRVVKKRYLTHKPEVVVYTATISRLLFSAISFVIGTIAIVAIGGERIFSVVFIVLLFNTFLSNLKFGMTNRFEYLLESRKIVVASNLATLVGSILQLVAISQQYSIVAVAWIGLLTSLMNLSVVFFLYKKQFSHERGYMDRELLFDMLKESLPLAIAASCSTIYTKCDSVMLGSMLSATSVGIYAISLKLINVVQMAFVPIRESVYPMLIRLHSTDIKEYERKYLQITSVLTWIYIIGVIFSFAVLPIVFKILKPEYLEALSVYRLHVLGTFFIYNSGLRAGHYTLIKRGDILMKVQILCVGVNIVLNIAGIKLFGMYGAALATVITECVSLLFSNLFFKAGREVFIWQIKALNPKYIFAKK